MRIGIDARMFGPTVGGGGLGRYVEQLILELQKQDHENRYILFLKRENFETCRVTNPYFEKRLADIHWYTWKEQLAMPSLIKKAGVELMHFPHWNVPMFSNVPFVVTIHDLILLDEPGSARATTRHPLVSGLKRLGYRVALRHAIFRSKKIIAVSKTTKQSILKHFPKIPSEKIRVIYEGLTAFPTPRLHDSCLRQGFGGQATTPRLPTPYFLHIGNAYPHKNLETLLRAFSLFHTLHPNVHLVLAGRRDVFFEQLEHLIKDINVSPDHIHFIFNPDDALLADLYANAALYVFPSRCEGFGLPALEAIGKGISVAAAHAGSLPEILGDAAVYFDPNDLEDMARVMERAFVDEPLRRTLAQKGFEQIKKYSWSRTATETLDVYEGET